MASDTHEEARQYLEGVEYPAGKEDLVEAARNNDAPQRFIERLVELSISEYRGPDEVAEAMDSSRPDK